MRTICTIMRLERKIPMSWKDRLPWLLLATLWLESALFRPYLSSILPLFPVFITVSAAWSVWIPPLVVVFLYMMLAKIFAKKSWLPWVLTTLSSIYILADIVIFSTHLKPHAETLWLRIPTSILILSLFIIARIQKQTRFGSWVSIVAAIGMASVFWGSPLWALTMAIILAGIIWHRQQLPKMPPQNEKSRS